MIVQSASPRARGPEWTLPADDTGHPWPTLDLEDEPYVSDPADLAREAAHLRDLERVVFLVEATGDRIPCLLNPETFVVRRRAGIRPRRSAVGQLTGTALAD